MKLRNKKTGEIVEKYPDRFVINSGEQIRQYASLAELNEEWEDAPEEPKEYYCIDWTEPDGIYKTRYVDVRDDFNKEIGNYFNTREEAEKAVEKLKAWKRLKDKGFRFDDVPALGHCDDEKFDISIIATMPAKWWYNDKVIDDIHYVFGGEE